MIHEQMKMTYYAPKARRHFLTKRAAIRAEARAIIKSRYPTEREECENGYQTSPGWHWSCLPHADKLFRRVCRMVARASA